MLCNCFGTVLTIDAATMKREVLEKRRRILGDDHPDTIMAMDNLASTLGDLGQLDEAVTMLNITVQQMRLTLGNGQPHTRLALNNLARYSSTTFSEESQEQSSAEPRAPGSRSLRRAILVHLDPMKPFFHLRSPPHCICSSEIRGNSSRILLSVETIYDT